MIAMRLEKGVNSQWHPGLKCETEELQDVKCKVHELVGSVRATGLLVVVTLKTFHLSSERSFGREEKRLQHH